MIAFLQEFGVEPPSLAHADAAGLVCAMRASKTVTPALLQQLSQSQMYLDYERAFSEATGLPLSLRPVDAWRPAHRGKRHENPFCMLMATRSRTCAACLQVQEQLAQMEAAATEKTVTCFAGLCDSAVPVRLGGELIGLLQTGQVFLKRPSRARFARTTRQLVNWGLDVDMKALEEAYFQTRVISPRQYQAVLQLLKVFAEHLSLVSNQLMVRERNAEPPAITRARQFIQERQGDPLSLTEVSRAVNMSTFYFCKQFRKATGLHFTEYLSRLRVEKAKNLLLNPNLRVSEIAYQVGFQSLTHFNRVFRKFTGQPPTAWRAALPRP